MKKSIELRFGPLCPPLSEQLAGLIPNSEALEHFQKDVTAINRLLLRGVITDGEADRARRRLMSSIVALTHQHKEQAT